MSSAFCNISTAAAEVFCSFGFIALVLQSISFHFRNSDEIPEIVEQLGYLFSNFLIGSTITKQYKGRFSDLTFKNGVIHALNIFSVFGWFF